MTILVKLCLIKIFYFSLSKGALTHPKGIVLKTKIACDNPIPLFCILRGYLEHIEILDTNNLEFII